MSPFTEHGCPTGSLGSRRIGGAREAVPTGTFRGLARSGTRL